jgi:hypothetical protein
MKTEKKRLYLDDVRTPISEDWIVVRNYDDFVTEVKRYGLERFEVISLDHDLGDSAMIEYYTNVKNNYTIDYSNITEKTGLDAAKFLVAESMNRGIPLPQIYVHSANPVGTHNILGYVNNYFKNCRTHQIAQYVKIEHTIDEQFQLSPEVREARWDRSKNSE